MPIPGDRHKKCLTCGRSFRYSRDTAKYCSAACRQRACRGDTTNELLDRTREIASEKIDFLGLMMSKGGETEARARHRLRQLINQAQAYLDDTTIHRPEMQFFICEQCGQSYFGDNPPGYCQFCETTTKWARSPLNS